MIRHTSFLHLDPALGVGARTELLESLREVPDRVGEIDGFVAFYAAPTAARSVGGGDIMVLAAVRRREDLEKLHRHEFVSALVAPLLKRCCLHVQEVVYQQGPVGVRDPALRDGIHRTLLLQVEPMAPPEAVTAFERQLVGMPNYIDSIRNWSLSRPDAQRHGGWTHVWEQEYDSVDGLLGPYMLNPYHWGVVDRWFDPESPTRVVDSHLVHAFCDLERSILARAATMPWQ